MSRHKHYNEVDNYSIVVKHLEQFEVYDRRQDAYVRVEHAFLHEGEDGVIGIAVILNREGGEVMIRLISGDDGHWRFGADMFSSYWVLGMVRLTKYVERWLRKNCDRFIYDEKPCGWRARS